jgi:ankyrin repeat protein
MISKTKEFTELAKKVKKGFESCSEALNLIDELGVQGQSIASVISNMENLLNDYHAGIDFNEWADKLTILMWAVILGQVDVVKEALKKPSTDANMHIFSPWKLGPKGDLNTALSLAVRSGNTEIVRLLLPKVPLAEMQIKCTYIDCEVYDLLTLVKQTDLASKAKGDSVFNSYSDRKHWNKIIYFENVNDKKEATNTKAVELMRKHIRNTKFVAGAAACLFSASLVGVEYLIANYMFGTEIFAASASMGVVLGTVGVALAGLFIGYEAAKNVSFISSIACKFLGEESEQGKGR